MNKLGKISDIRTRKNKKILSSTKIFSFPLGVGLTIQSLRIIVHVCQLVDFNGQNLVFLKNDYHAKKVCKDPEFKVTDQLNSR